MLKRRWAAMEGLGYSYLFPALKGRSWAGVDAPRGHATSGIQRHIDALGLNDNPDETRVTPHTFRDTFASRMVQAGVSLLKVSHLLGHADVSMTKKYAHLCPDALGHESAAVLDAIHGAEVSPHRFPHSTPPRSERLALQLAANDPQVLDTQGDFSGEMVGRTRFELVTNGLKVRCSTN